MTTASFQDSLIQSGVSLREAMVVLDKSTTKIVLVVDKDRRLLGTMTDGDVRRALIGGATIDDPVEKIMNPRPVSARAGTPVATLQARMRELTIRHIPLLDADGRIVGLEIPQQAAGPQTRDNIVVLLAGGLGRRLHPATESCPKPLIELGGKPILERILERFREAGFHRFYISVNHLADMVVDHFGEGEQWGCEIHYLHEDAPLGTAGCLGVLPEVPEQPIVVMNGDVVTHIDLGSLLDFHEEHQAMATVCARSHDIQIPYGALRVSGCTLEGIVEKPIHTTLVNAGIYVLEPEVLDLVPAHQPRDMPDVLQELMVKGRSIAVFPIHEYWIDIGRPEDLERARKETLSA